ncbi:hypothetical protein ASG04_15335 [Curtobacterium sp. Leaf183]|uniref:sucrase ferredoxin n=1 Tax=Curtobacterium sp. Leaf183 TaxID=1736291 RepID=UPI0006FB25B5|nr:sucrase ferredoxin [Curtobacterium sp. Leaf183]KQS07486.1 hypothetical protein ASG04_15335 [Curtobacterium sp. Leaf183]
MTEWRRTGPSDPGRPRSGGGPACSAGSRLRDEDVSATASPGRRWLLVEVAGAWGWNVWTESPVLDPEVGAALARRVQHAGMRILAVRRPGRSRGSGRWRWAVVDAERATTRWGEVSDPRQLLTLPLDGSTGTPSDQALFAVCAHGRHDECCAVRGRSVAERLSGAYPDETWECSHLGGDRFAATMMLFPHAVNHGRVDEHDPVAIADEYLHGRIAQQGFRGRATLSHVEQAAVAAAVQHTGDTRLEAFRPVAATELTTEPGGWSVDLSARTDTAAEPQTDAGTRTIRVRLEHVLTGPTFTTCRATVAVEIPRFVVRDLTVIG